MLKREQYADLGAAVALLGGSEYHGKYGLGFYITTHIIPPFKLGQYRVYRNDEGAPDALVTWARLSEEVKDDLIQNDRNLWPSEWDSGHIVFFNDWISPFGNMRDIAADLGATLFKDDVGFSFRRSNRGSKGRRVDHWHGRDLIRKK